MFLSNASLAMVFVYNIEILVSYMEGGGELINGSKTVAVMACSKKWHKSPYSQLPCLGSRPNPNVPLFEGYFQIRRGGLYHLISTV